MGKIWCWKILVSRQLSSTNKSHISGASIAAKKISEECNVAMATVYKYSAYSSALDIIDEKFPILSNEFVLVSSGFPKLILLSFQDYQRAAFKPK